MSWNSLNPIIQALAEDILTEGQLKVFKLALAGRSKRQIAIHLDLPRTTVSDRITAIERTLRHHGITQDASGRWAIHPKDAA